MSEYNFGTGFPGLTRSCTLNNGNVALAWRNFADQHIYTAVYDSSGTKLGGDTELTSYVVTVSEALSIDALGDGNYVVAYSESQANGISFSICSNVAAVVQGSTKFASPTPSNENQLDAIALNNGGFMLVYGSSTNMWVTTHNSSWAVVTSPTQIEAGISATSPTRGVLLANTNVMIVFEDSTGSSGTLIVVDEAGTVVALTKAVFTIFTVECYPKPVLLADNNVMIIYQDATNGDVGKFVIYQQDATLVKGPTLFADTPIGDMDFGAALTSASSEVLIAYKDGGSGNDGYYTVINSDGDLVTAATLIESDQFSYAAVATFGDNNDAIIWSRTTGSEGVIDIQTYTSGFAPPADIVTNKRLIAFANNTLFYEDI